MPACGLDFGTSNTTLGSTRDSAPWVHALEGEQVTIPSAIFFGWSGEPTFGRAAMATYVEGVQGRLMRSLKSVLGTSLAEATEGLAPVVREETWLRLAELKRTGLSILVIDKELEELTALADRHYIIEKGEIVWSGPSADLMADTCVRETYLGV